MTKPTLTEYLAQVKARCEGMDVLDRSDPRLDEWCRDERVKAFIAHSRTDVEALLKMLECLRDWGEAEQRGEPRPYWWELEIELEALIPPSAEGEKP